MNQANDYQSKVDHQMTLEIEKSTKLFLRKRSIFQFFETIQGNLEQKTVNKTVRTISYG